MLLYPDDEVEDDFDDLDDFDDFDDEDDFDEDEDDSEFDNMDQQKAEDNLEDSLEEEEPVPDTLEEESTSSEAEHIPSPVIEDTEEEEESVEEDDDTEDVPAQTAPPEELVALRDIPLDITVELGKIRMNASQVGDLRPGNLLETNVDVNSAVSLVVNGKHIGRAELMRVGKVLGLRVIEIAD